MFELLVSMNGPIAEPSICAKIPTVVVHTSPSRGDVGVAPGGMLIDVFARVETGMVVPVVSAKPDDAQTVKKPQMIILNLI